jgi:Leucine-rich repeat (LRR) protein
MAFLPPDILLRIFPHLSHPSLLNVVQVSKLWNSVAIPFLWRNFRFNESDLSHCAPLFKIYGPFIRDVVVCGMSLVYESVKGASVKDGLSLVVTMCSNITSLELQGAKLTTQDMAMLCEHLSGQLECLCINCCSWVDGMLPSAPYIGTLGKLKRLVLIHNTDFNDAACRLVVTGCPLLEDLVLKYTKITDTSVCHFAQRLPRLRSLDLGGYSNITDTSLIAIAESHPPLEEMVLIGASITDAGIRLVSQHLPHLRSLNFSYCKLITDISLIAIAESCPLLEDLNLTETSVTDTGFQFAAQHLPHLRSLVLIDCNMITNISLIAIAESCPLLENLNLSYTSVTGFCLAAQHLPRLRSLILNNCWGITDSSLVAIAESCPLLEVLKVGRASITDTGVCVAAQHFPRLHSLSLDGCEITDISLKAITESFPLLTSLNVADTKITDPNLFAPARCWETITFLNLSETKCITDAGLQQIVMQFTQLRHLILSSCGSLTKDFFDGPPWKCTKLVKLEMGFLEVGSSALFCVSKLTSLVILNLEGLQGEVSEAALLSLGKLPNLRILDLSSCDFLNDDMAKMIVRNCSLTYFRSVESEGLSDHCARELLQLYPNTETVTYAGFARCTALRSFE